MWSSLFVSRTAHLLLLHLSYPVVAQSGPGGSFYSGSGSPGAAAYQLVDDYNPSGFFDKFTFYDQYDPTYGHVKYVNKSVALTNGYAYYSATNNSAVIKPDTTNQWPPGNLPNGQYLPGRPSVRITSLNTYFHGLFIFDASHMPTGCGTWPAYWLLGPNWPSTGEIDIIEGVHTSTTNTLSLHTSPNCSVMGSGQTGLFATSNCDSNDNGNSGCGSVLSNDTVNLNNYGAPFNAIRGGVYATEWTSNYIKHWWFPRGQIPPGITTGTPDVSTFGEPAVNAQGACNIDEHFRNVSIIINIDFCGAWAGGVYEQYPNCPQNVSKTTTDTAVNRCAAFVGAYPNRMTEAYWEINRIQVYQMPASIATTSVYSTSLSSVAPLSQSTNTIPLGMGATTTTLPSAPGYSGPVSSATSSGPVSAPIGASCPVYNGQVVSDAAGYQYTLQCSQEYNAASAYVLETSSFDSCLVLCDGWPGCLGVTFAPSSLAGDPNGRGTCYSKESATGYYTSSTNVNSAARVGGPAQLGAIVNTSNRPATSKSASSQYASPVYSSRAAASRSSQNLPALTSSAAGGPVSSVELSASSSRVAQSSTESSGQNPAASSSALASYSSSSATAASSASTFASPTYTSASLNTATSSMVTLVATTYLTRTSDGVTYTTSLPITIATTSTFEAPGQYPAESFSSSEGTSSSADTIFLTSVSEYTSDSTTHSSTFSPTSTDEVTPSESPSSYSSGDSESTMISATSIGYTSSGVTHSSTTDMTVMSSAPTTALSTDALASSSSAAVSSFPAATSVAPNPACPSTYDSACGAQSSSSDPYCSSSNGNTYAVQCGRGYTGTTIPDNDVNITVVPDSYKRELLPGFANRVTVPNYASCQATCENTANCVAFQFQPINNCTLFSQVTGTYDLPGGVGVTAVPDTSSPPTYVIPSTSLAQVTHTSPSATTLSGSIFSSSSSSTAVDAPNYGGGASVTTTVSGTQTYTIASTVTTSFSSGTTVAAVTTTIISTLPPGGSFTTSGASSFYVVSSTASLAGGCASSICFTCAITPIITGGCSNTGPPTTTASLPPLVTTGSGSITATMPTTTIRPTTSSRSMTETPNIFTTSMPVTCPIVVSGTGYTTILTTYTITTCPAGVFCANPGYTTIGNNTASMPSKVPSLTDLPKCASGCVIDYSPCTSSDVACICKNQPFLKSVTDCVAAGCSDNSIQAVISYANKLCSANGVTSLPTAGVSYTGTVPAKSTSSRPVPAVSELPNCAQGCVLNFAPCDASDVRCICSNQPYLASIRNCIANGCSDASIQDVIVYANNVCNGYGVTALPTSGITYTGTLTHTAVVTRTTLTAVPSVTDLPECAQGCVINYGSCGQYDVACICQNKPYLDSIVSCVRSGCNQTTIEDIFDFAENLCGGYGVQITTVVSYVPTTIYQPTTILSTYVTTASGGSLIVGTSTAVVTGITVIPTYGSGPGTGRGTGVATVTTGPTVTVTGSPSNLPRCPYNNGQSYVDSNGQVYIITCDSSFTDAVLDTSSQPRFIDCMSHCDAYNTMLTSDSQQCGGISFISTQDADNCLLQVGDTIGGTAPGVWSGRLISRAATKPAVGTDPGTGAAPTSYLVSTVNQGSGPGTPTQYIPGSTVYSVTRAITTIVSNGVSYTSVIGVTTVVSVSYNTNTVTTTTLSVSIQPTTIQNTITGGTATVTLAGPTITATPSSAGIVTVTQGNGGGTVTSIIYVQPSSSSSINTCRTTSTNYYNGLTPMKRDSVRFDLGELRPVPAARPKAKPRYH